MFQRLGAPRHEACCFPSLPMINGPTNPAAGWLWQYATKLVMQSFKNMHIGIDQSDVFARALPNSNIVGLCKPKVFRIADQLYVGELLPHHRGRPVSRRIVDDDNLRRTGIDITLQ